MKHDLTITRFVRKPRVERLGLIFGKNFKPFDVYKAFSNLKQARENFAAYTAKKDDDDFHWVLKYRIAKNIALHGAKL